jgi:hypothetical protein
MPFTPTKSLPCQLLRFGRRAYTSKPGRLLGTATAILLVGVLAATAARSQGWLGAAAAGDDSTGKNSMTEIPQATGRSSSFAGTGAANLNEENAETDADRDSYEDQAARRGQTGGGEEPAAGQSVRDNGEGGPPKLSNLDEFVSNDDTYESLVGALLQHNCTELTDRQVVCGLAVLEVRPGSAAVAAGVRPYSGLGHTLLGAAVVSAAMVFPPAIAGLGFVEQSHVGESFDLIIGVDGHRIRSIPDFEDATADVRGGDMLYLTVIRGGKRLQIPVRVTRQKTAASTW